MTMMLIMMVMIMLLITIRSVRFLTSVLLTLTFFLFFFFYFCIINVLFIRRLIMSISFRVYNLNTSDTGHCLKKDTLFFFLILHILQLIFFLMLFIINLLLNLFNCLCNNFTIYLFHAYLFTVHGGTLKYIVAFRRVILLW